MPSFSLSFVESNNLFKQATIWSENLYLWFTIYHKSLQKYEFMQKFFHFLNLEAS